MYVIESEYNEDRTLISEIHNSFDAAKKEAERLKQPGHVFRVFKLTGELVYSTIEEPLEC